MSVPNDVDLSSSCQACLFIFLRESRLEVRFRMKDLRVFLEERTRACYAKLPE